MPHAALPFGGDDDGVLLEDNLDGLVSLQEHSGAMIAAATLADAATENESGNDGVDEDSDVDELLLQDNGECGDNLATVSAVETAAEVMLEREMEDGNEEQPTLDSNCEAAIDGAAMICVAIDDGAVAAACVAIGDDIVDGRPLPLPQITTVSEECLTGRCEEAGTPVQCRVCAQTVAEEAVAAWTKAARQASQQAELARAAAKAKSEATASAWIAAERAVQAAEGMG